jgi:hypothetical protein
MGRNSGDASKNKKIRTIAIVSILVMMVGAFVIWGGPALGLYSMGADEDEEVVVIPVVEYDFYAFNMTSAFNSNTSLKYVNCTPYTVSSIGLDDEDIAALTYSDFTAGTKKTDIDEKDQFDIDDYDDELVIFLLEQKDSQSKWISPVPGINYDTMMNESTDINLIAFERDGGSFTVNQTTDQKWTVQVKAITDAHDSKLGFESPLFDFPNDVWNYTVIRLKCNETSKFANFDMPAAALEVVNGEYSFFYFSDDWTSVNFTDYALNIASTVGTDFELIEIASGYGNLDSAITIYDTQN